jgi:hypothetical protein
MKFQHKLPSDSTTDLMLLFNFLRAQFLATGFHHALIPDVGEIHPLIDLARSPVDVKVMSNRNHPEWSAHNHWVDAHRALGYALHRILAMIARDSSTTAIVFCRVFSEHSYSGNGSAVLNELLRMHFPHVHGTHAPSFDAAAILKVTQTSGETIPECEQRFTLWLKSLQLYREFGRYQDSEVTMWFIDGLLARHQLFLDKEYVDLKQFHSLHRLAADEPILPEYMQRFNLCERLRLAPGPDPRRRSHSAPLGAQVTIIEESST